MKHTISMSEEERKVFVRVFERLLHVFSSVPATENPQGVKSDSTVLTTRRQNIERGSNVAGVVEPVGAAHAGGARVYVGYVL